MPVGEEVIRHVAESLHTLASQGIILYGRLRGSMLIAASEEQKGVDHIRRHLPESTCYRPVTRFLPWALALYMA
jgi:hypothetical protein